MILVPLLFDIAGYLKGYAGGLVVFRLGSLRIGLVGSDPDDPGVSFTVCRLTRVRTMNRSVPAYWRGRQMCKVIRQG